MDDADHDDLTKQSFFSQRPVPETSPSSSSSVEPDLRRLEHRLWGCCFSSSWSCSSRRRRSTCYGRAGAPPAMAARVGAPSGGAVPAIAVRELRATMAEKRTAVACSHFGPHGSREEAVPV